MSFFKKLKDKIAGITGKNIDTGISIQELEDILIEADFGFSLSSKIASDLKGNRDIIASLRLKLEEILNPLVKDFEINVAKKPFVIVMAGVNGSGKTTTLAKLAYLLKKRGLSVDIAACDTFRVAATEQLSSWASKLNCLIFKSDTPRDPASVAFEAIEKTESDVLIIDTAGRLQNNTNLMNELSKIYRVIQKVDPSAPHMNILVIDATTGQNAIDQAKDFGAVHPITGIIISKMDGNSKGGIIARMANDLKLPILGVGIGESEQDFEKFSVDKFLNDLTK